MAILIVLIVVLVVKGGDIFNNGSSIEVLVGMEFKMQ